MERSFGARPARVALDLLGGWLEAMEMMGVSGTRVVEIREAGQP